MPKVRAGSRLAEHQLTAIDGAVVPVPDPTAIVHLQLLRFAGCPICHLHVHQLAGRQEEIRTAGIREVVVFHSEPALLREYQNDLPFDVIGDPEKRLYSELGVETSIRSVLSARALGAGLIGLIRGASFRAGVTAPENRFSMPADFLIGTDGIVLAAKYGRHANDNWSVDELLAIASSHSAA
jgi:peroxiredoxin